MEVLLTHGYFLKEDVKEQAIMRPYPPLGLLYVSAYLTQHGVTNTVLDTTFEDRHTLEQTLLERQPAILAIYVNLMTKTKVLDIIRWVKAQPQLHNTRIVLGGPDVRYNADNLLTHGADFLVIGEGEATMLALVEALQNDQPLGEIRGLAWTNEAGQVVINPDRALIRELDELPFPARDQINLNHYLNAWKEHHGENALSVSTMRGCPYTCKWCSRAVYGKSYRRRSPKNVVDELVQLQQTYQPDTIWFVDDVFTVSHKWLTAFRDELVERKVQVRYECITRADRMNETVIQLLRESGCFRVWIGAESGSQTIIDRMDRRVDVHQVRNMIRATSAAGIQAGTFIMLGYPGETEEDIAETVRHLKAASPDHFTITVAYPIRGTELFQEVESIQTHEMDWATSTDRDIDFERTYPRKYYDYAVRWVVNEWRYQRFREKKVPLKQGLASKGKAVAARMGMWYVRKTLGKNNLSTQAG